MLDSASPSASARWCVICGDIRLCDPVEAILAPGNPSCAAKLVSGTPQQCVDAFATVPVNQRDVPIERLQAELARLDEILSRPTSNVERGKLLAEREAKARALQNLRGGTL